jgi:hypothetical protein
MADRWLDGFDPSFLSAAASCALRNGRTDAATLEAYFRTNLRYVDPLFYTNIFSRLARKVPSDPRVVTVAKETSQALPVIDFVYLDVGCWAGNGDDLDTKAKGWTKHREFGVVSGYVILLCAFVPQEKPNYYDRYSNPQAWNTKTRQLVPSPLIDATLTRHPDWPRVADLLNTLANCVPKSAGLYILGATALASIYAPVPARGKAAPITIFLGDMHAPVAISPASAHILEGGNEMLHGRLEVSDSDLHWLRSLVADPWPLFAGKVGKRILDNQKDLQWEQTTTRESVDNWLRLYHVKGQRSADIFQDAGKDLRAFVDALKDFHQKTWPLELVQLGDLFDLWLGFQRAFGEKLGKTPALDNLHGRALDFAHYWVKRTLFETDQGPHLVHLLTLGERAGKNRQTGASLRTTFIHGNHDNYLRHGGGRPIEVPAGHEHAGMQINAFHLPSFEERIGLWAEHGHQPDSFNRDENPSVGHQLTQAAFFQPDVRNLEGPGGWTTSMGNGKGIQRVKSLDHALDRCLRNHIHPTNPEPCRGVYVMGHTHEPMLKRVELLPCPPHQYR